MSIKIIDRKIESSARGFKTLKLKYIDTKSGKTWWTEGDLGKRKKLKIDAKTKKA